MFREKEAVASMRFTFRRAGGPRGMSWAARAVVAAVLAGGVTAATAGIAAAQTGPGPTGTSAVVVKEAFRTGFGKMLVTHGAGMALYTNPAGCSAACQSIWPPLVMPAGATTPTGAPCLATAKLGNKLQVTYHKLRLYTFVNDTGHSVTGNGVAGFHVAKVTKTCTAAR
jgi:predicted lipoprotein with Yx(FWY)xxD motif